MNLNQLINEHKENQVKAIVGEAREKIISDEVSEDNQARIKELEELEEKSTWFSRLWYGLKFEIAYTYNRLIRFRHYR